MITFLILSVLGVALFAWIFEAGGPDFIFLLIIVGLLDLIVLAVWTDLEYEDSSERWTRLFNEGKCEIVDKREVTGRITGKAHGLTSYTIYNFECPGFEPVWTDSF